MLKNKLQTRLNKGSGRIIWAFDPKFEEKDPFTKFKKNFSEVQDYIAAVKFNRQLILPHGLQNPKLNEIISLVSDAGIPLIMDAKVNDIGYTNESIAKNYFGAGFDALICNPFVGEEGLEPILKTAKSFNRDVIFLVYMSHQTADFGYGRKIFFSDSEKKELGKDTGYYYELFAHLANKLGAAGTIVGATYPEKVKEIRKILNPDTLILSPGVGAQGGEFKKTREAGMDFAIIGRAITEESNRVQYCKEILQDLK